MDQKYISSAVAEFARSIEVCLYKLEALDSSLMGFVFVLPEEQMGIKNLKLAQFTKQLCQDHKKITVQYGQHPVLYYERSPLRIVIYVKSDSCWDKKAFCFPSQWVACSSMLPIEGESLDLTALHNNPNRRYESLICRRTFLQRLPYIFVGEQSSDHLLYTLNQNRSLGYTSLKAAYLDAWSSWKKSWAEFQKNSNLSQLFDFI